MKKIIYPRHPATRSRDPENALDPVVKPQDDEEKKLQDDEVKKVR